MEATVAEQAQGIARRWLPALIESLDQSATEEQRVEILEYCGRACAENDLEEVGRIREGARDREHLLQLINERIPWCGEWVWDDGKIRTVCVECGCPLVKAGYVEYSATLCLCSRGWVKAVFEEALGEEVEVELVQAIGRGDGCCEFVVAPQTPEVSTEAADLV